MSYQTVKIRNKINTDIGNVTKEMLSFKGKTSKIVVKVEDFETNKTYYLLDIDNCSNIWTDEMVCEG